LAVEGQVVDVGRVERDEGADRVLDARAALVERLAQPVRVPGGGHAAGLRGREAELLSLCLGDGGERGQGERAESGERGERSMNVVSLVLLRRRGRLGRPMGSGTSLT